MKRLAYFAWYMAGVMLVLYGQEIEATTLATLAMSVGLTLSGMLLLMAVARAVFMAEIIRASGASGVALVRVHSWRGLVIGWTVEAQG